MSKVYLPHKKDDENVITLLRQHPFVIGARLAFWALVAAMPILVYLILGDVLKPFIFNISIFPIFLLFIAIYYLYIWLFTFNTFVEYYLDIWVITNYRILNIEQNGLFNRTFSEQQLNRVQDITSEVKGFFPTMLNFGNVYIQTAAEIERFSFEQIKDPQGCANKIAEIVEENKKLQPLPPTNGQTGL